MDLAESIEINCFNFVVRILFCFQYGTRANTIPHYNMSPHSARNRELYIELRILWGRVLSSGALKPSAQTDKSESVKGGGWCVSCWMLNWALLYKRANYQTSGRAV